MLAQEVFEKFSFLGGPLHRLGCRLHLVRNRNTLGIGIALSAFLWVVWIILALLDGNSSKILSLSGHVRILIAIPLFYLTETWVDPRWNDFVRDIVRTGIVLPSELPALKSNLQRFNRARDSWIPESVCFLAGILLIFVAGKLQYGITADVSSAGRSLSGWWYYFFCLTAFRFLILRWVFKMMLWCYFLRKLSILKLNLIPSHPDHSAGLAYLEIIHSELTLLAFTISAVQSASLAEELSADAAAIDSILPTIALVVAFNFILIVGPLFIFTHKLWNCKVTGISDYMAFATRYVSEFDKKWIHGSPVPTESLLGTADLQSLADLSNSVNNVREMRVIPSSPVLFMHFMVMSLIPMIPLLLFKYPLTTLLEKFFERLSGF